MSEFQWMFCSFVLRWSNSTFSNGMATTLLAIHPKPIQLAASVTMWGAQWKWKCAGRAQQKSKLNSQVYNFNLMCYFHYIHLVSHIYVSEWYLWPQQSNTKTSTLEPPPLMPGAGRALRVLAGDIGEGATASNFFEFATQQELLSHDLVYLPLQPFGNKMHRSIVRLSLDIYLHTERYGIYIMTSLQQILKWTWTKGQYRILEGLYAPFAAVSSGKVKTV